MTGVLGYEELALQDYGIFYSVTLPKCNQVKMHYSHHVSENHIE